MTMSKLVVELLGIFFSVCRRIHAVTVAAQRGFDETQNPLLIFDDQDRTHRFSPTRGFVLMKGKKAKPNGVSGLFKCNAMNCQTVKSGVNRETTRCYEQILSR
jgi:hypothetical protein